MVDHPNGSAVQTDPTEAEQTKPPEPIFGRPVLVVIALIVLIVAAIVVVPHIHGPVRPSAARAGVPIVVGDTVYLVNGGRIRIPLNGGSGPAQLEIVPGGYLYNAFSNDGSAQLWLADGEGAYQNLGTLGDSRYRVSPDGRTAVAIMSTAIGTDAAAIDLASGKRLVNKTMGRPYVVDISDDWALLDDGDSPVDARASEVWNIRTGQVIRLPDPDAREYALLPSGDVFRGMGVPGVNGPTGPFTACYDTFDPAAAASVSVPRVCEPGAVFDAMASPDGTWLFAPTYDQSMFLRVTDIRAEQWRPVDVDPGDYDSRFFWDSPTTMVFPNDSGFERCSVTGQCHDVHLPANAFVAQVLGVHD